jgi:hypothetical protein
MGKVSTPKLKLKKRFPHQRPTQWRQRRAATAVGTERSRRQESGREQPTHKDNYRTKYTIEDMDMAVQRVREEGCSVSQAAKTAVSRV